MSQHHWGRPEASAEQTRHEASFPGVTFDLDRAHGGWVHALTLLAGFDRP